MSISIFTIKNHGQAFYNLDNAIHAAKAIAKESIMDYVRESKEIVEKHNPENKTFSNENLRDCVLKYSVTQYSPNEVKVRARLNIPVQNDNDPRMNDTVTRSLIIVTSQIKPEAMRDIETPFATL